MTNSNIAIKLQNIHQSYYEKDVLVGLDLQLEKGQTIGIVGKNGAGKSTILKIIAGYISKFDGIYVQNIKTFSALIENPIFIDGLSGLENIKYILNKKEYDIAISFAQQFGLLDYIDKSVRKYSMGMKQKLAIAIVFSRDAELYLLDEPFNSIDYETATKLIDIINSKRMLGVSTIVVTHNMSRIEEYCDNIFQLKDGILKTKETMDHSEIQHKKYLLKFASVEALEFAKSILSEFAIFESEISNCIIVKSTVDNVGTILKKLADHSLIGLTEI
ncbi:MAG: ABC transporter ATP-binding protein [Christensenellaceae bacterium]|jgi:ABC-2 type transport system ATP-binding protein|nr:ABC transporter ATP-binding protein [Christensenellaceae bacterium]